MLALFMAAKAVDPEMAETRPRCSVEVAQMLKLSEFDFDQSDRGWRILARRGCDHEAAELIKTYREAHFPDVNYSGLQMSYWHEGQERAFEGRNDLAIPLLLASVQPAKSDGPEARSVALAWTHYALATVGFLNRDLHALRAERERLAAVSEPAFYEGYYKAAPADLRAALKWPPNLNVVDGLLACFGKPYSEAYGCKAQTAFP
jgi:hypothetical protein